MCISLMASWLSSELLSTEVASHLFTIVEKMMEVGSELTNDFEDDLSQFYLNFIVSPIILAKK